MMWDFHNKSLKCLFMYFEKVTNTLTSREKNASATFWLFIWNLLFSISWGDIMIFFLLRPPRNVIDTILKKIKVIEKVNTDDKCLQHDYCYHSKLLLSLVRTLRCTVHSVYLDPISYLTCLLSILQHILKKTF